MQKADKIVVTVFDGLRPDMVTAALMPRLAAFAENSLWFREARSVFPSMTRVATSSIATGAPPSVHGVVGNAFYYPDVTRAHVLDTSRPDDVALAEAAIGGPLLTAETFADLLAKAGRSFAVVHTGSAGSCYAINPRVKANGHWTFSVMGEEFTRTPEAVREVVARFGPLPPRTLPGIEETEYGARVFVEHVLGQIKPDVALVWFNEPDTSYHYRFLGSDDAHKALAAVDAAFGHILDAVSAAPDGDRTAIIVASDHGQISSNGITPISRLLTDAGHRAARASTRSLDGAQVAITGGNMGEIRVLDGDQDRRDAIANWLMTRDEIGMVFTASDDPVRGAVEGTFSTRLVRLDHARGPDLVYVLRSSLEHDAHGLPGLGLITDGDVPMGGGMHGGLNRHELNTVLMIGGAGASTGVDATPCGIIDIAPTILGLLGLPAGTSMQGRNLADGELAPAILEHHEAAIGAFRQTLTVAQRGAHLFPIHGGRG
ncbi:MAG: alkaline phosphatase family protein [Bosea sp. (in: a-proteobacteria)]